MSVDLAAWLQTAASERKVYEHPPLALTLCQIRFAKRFGLDNSTTLAQFQELIEDTYPNADQSVQQVTPIRVSSAGVPLVSQSLNWQFADEDGNWTVTLSDDFISLETRAYADFEEFISRLSNLLAVLHETIRPKLARRIGLRYINEVRSTSRDWQNIIRPELLGALSLDLIRNNCEQSIQVMTLRTDDAKINIQHGVFPQGTTVVPPLNNSPKGEPFYLLDFDIYHEVTPPESMQMEPSVQVNRVKGFHQTASAFFRWATTDDYRASLGERSNGG